MPENTETRTNAGGKAPEGGTPRRDVPPSAPGSNVRDFTAARREAARRAEIGRVQQARRRRRAGNYLIYYILLGMILTAVCVTLSLTVFFNVTAINVSGSSLYTTDQVLAAVDVKTGDNLIRLNTRRLEERALAQLTGAESVEIARRFPNSLDITVTDGDPSMQILVNGVYYGFTGSGRLVSQTQTPLVDAQVLVGSDPSGLETGQYLTDLPEEQQATFSTWRTVTALTDKYGIHDLSAMDLSDELSLRLFYQNRIEIDLGPLSDMDAKIAALSTILYGAGSIGVEETGVLDLANADRAYFNNQSACTLPTGAGTLGWSWQDEYSETLMQSLFGAQQTTPSPPEAGTVQTPGGTSAEGDASAADGAASGGESTAVTDGTSASQSSEESYATSGGMRLPQLPSVGGTSDALTSSAPAPDAPAPLDGMSAPSTESSGVSDSQASSAPAGSAPAQQPSSALPGAGDAASGGSTGSGVGSQAPSVPGIG